MNPAGLQLDHLVVGAASLAQGVAWCENTLGVTPGPGGAHPLMGTHNRLLKLGGPDFDAAYLEIIAIDPDAPTPQRRRWFGLGEAALQVALERSPRLIHLVARCAPGQLAARREALQAAGLDPGTPVAAGRETAAGPLRWQILVRDDGLRLFGGALPTLIEWQGRHPTQDMPECGLQLQSLTLRGLPVAVAAALPLHGVQFSGTAGAALQAVLATPLGERTLLGD